MLARGPFGVKQGKCQHGRSFPAAGIGARRRSAPVASRPAIGAFRYGSLSVARRGRVRARIGAFRYGQKARLKLGPPRRERIGLTVFQRRPYRRELASAAVVNGHVNPKRMPRLFDLIALGAIAVVVLLPKASVDARPALAGEPMELDRVAELQDDLFHSPNDTGAALKLSSELLALGRTDWALQTLAPFADRDDHRVHLLLATAHAERLEPSEAVAECRRFDEACAKAPANAPTTAGPPDRVPPCSEGEAVKAGLLRDAMQALVDGKIDAASDPVKARKAVYKALHPARYNFAISPLPPASPPAR